MKLKTLIVTVLLLALASTAVYIARRPAPPPAADPRVGQPVLAANVAENAAKVRLSEAGSTVVLAQRDGAWRNASYRDLPADTSKLAQLLNNLVETKVERLVTAKPERISRLEFRDSRIELLDTNEQIIASITLGKSANVGAGRYLRYGEENKAYQANLNVWLDASAKNWTNTQLTALNPDDIAKIEATFPDELGTTLTFSRARKEDPWRAEPTPAGQRLLPDKINTVARTLATVRFMEATDPTEANAVAARPHERVFKLSTFDGKTTTYRVGRKPEEKKLKPPVPAPDGSTGPASLGSITDMAKQEGGASGEAAKPIAPEFETIPAGPVFIRVASSDTSAAVNALMEKAAFQVADYVFTQLPAKAGDCFEPEPTPMAPARDGKAEDSARETPKSPDDPSPQS